MRISISNIAWELDEEPAIAEQLRAAGVERVDIAPGKYFPDPAAATEAEMAAVRELWRGRGFAIEGMQALLFGTSGLNLFADPDDVMLDRLSAICRIGGGVGARALTFGSPRQRDRTGLDEATTQEVAVRFFRRLGDVAVEHGVIVCLEPNPAIYNCNFMVTADETAEVVAVVDHPGIRMQLDVGALALNGENPATTIARHAALIGHVHASEPRLAVLGEGGAAHVDAAAAFRAARPELAVTIEMAPAPIPHAEAVARAVTLAQEVYGG